jgi:HPt (histidine-containing phosphotransfer) domain-containing protein
MIDPMDECIDVHALMDRLEDDRELLKELVGLYLEDEQRLLDQIAAAVLARQADALRRTAHTLKGSVGNFCAPAAHAAAAALEAAGREGRLDESPRLLDDLARELDRVRVALRELVDGQP